MLKFINTNDFMKVDAFEECENGAVCWTLKENGVTHVGDIYKGFTRTDESDNKIDVWQKLIELDEAGEISVKWLTQADKAAISAKESEATAERLETLAKFNGVEIAGEQISLTEENQNGMAAVMQGVNLAAEMGADIFPLNFNAQTPAGFKLMTFEAAADFKTFCLTFMAERQKFFK